MEPEARRVTPGRLPERVYWFRRAFVVVCLGLVIALLMWLGSLAGGPRTAAPRAASAPPATTQAPSPPDSLQATALPAPASTLTGSTSAPTDSTSAVTAAAPASSAPTAAACDPAVLTLDVTGPGTVKAGTTAPITVTVTNSGTDTCAFTFDSRFAFRIVSGSDPIWSIGDCAQWAPSGTQTLAQGAAATWHTTWDRHRSQATCVSVATTLKPGTYVASASYTGSSSAQLVMLLTA